MHCKEPAGVSNSGKLLDQLSECWLVERPHELIHARGFIVLRRHASLTVAACPLPFGLGLMFSPVLVTYQSKFVPLDSRARRRRCQLMFYSDWMKRRRGREGSWLI
jgi:hypothetical protein